LWDSTVEEIKGDKSVTSVAIKNWKTNKTEETPIDGVFIAIGYEPNTKIFLNQLPTDELGYLVTKDEVKTDVEGVFVAGDVADRVYRQAGTAAGSGIKAALEVRAYISELQAMRKI
jgi:thioredoxin reductase (NADPH)